MSRFPRKYSSHRLPTYLLQPPNQHSTTMYYLISILSLQSPNKRERNQKYPLELLFITREGSKPNFFSNIYLKRLVCHLNQRLRGLHLNLVVCIKRVCALYKFTFKIYFTKGTFFIYVPGPCRRKILKFIYII